MAEITKANPRAALGGPAYRIGHTGMLALTAGDRPFMVVRWDKDQKKYAGWVYLDPVLDAEDVFLRELGLTPEQRRRPCYCMVAPERIRWPRQ